MRAVGDCELWVGVDLFEGRCAGVEVAGAPDPGHGVCGEAGIGNAKLGKENAIAFGCVSGAVVNLTSNPARRGWELENLLDLGWFGRVQ